jgi:hypothetical protein
MKKLIFILLLSVVLFSCEDKYTSECEKEDTFLLVFKNPDLYISQLIVLDQVYDVSMTKALNLNVLVENAQMICVTMINSPDEPFGYIMYPINACDVFEYKWEIE